MDHINFQKTNGYKQKQLFSTSTCTIIVASCNYCFCSGKSIKGKNKLKHLAKFSPYTVPLLLFTDTYHFGMPACTLNIRLFSSLKKKEKKGRCGIYGCLYVISACDIRWLFFFLNLLWNFMELKHWILKRLIVCIISFKYCIDLLL